MCFLQVVIQITNDLMIWFWCNTIQFVNMSDLVIMLGKCALSRTNSLFLWNIGAGTFPGNSPNVPFYSFMVWTTWPESRPPNRGFLRARLEPPGWDSVVIVWCAFLTCSIFWSSKRKSHKKSFQPGKFSRPKRTQTKAVGDFGWRQGGLPKKD